MEETKGLAGRRVCGGIEICIGALLGIGAIYNATNGLVNILSFLVAAFIIVTGVLGIAAKNKGVIIAYMVTGIICALYFGYSTIASVIVLISYNNLLADAGLRDDSTFITILIVATVITVLAFIVSVLGVIFAALPCCGKSQGQDRAQQYNDGKAPVGAAAPPNYNYSNTAYVGTTQTQQYYHGNAPVGAAGPPNYNYNNNTAYVDTSQKV